MPEMRIPLCRTCAVDVSAQYLALTEDEREAAALPQPDHTLPPMDKYTERGFVYFVRFGDRVKIGFSMNVERRLKAIPHDEILAVMPGTFRDESRCHAAFAHLRIIGEWFEMGDDLMGFIA